MKRRSAVLPVACLTTSLLGMGVQAAAEEPAPETLQEVEVIGVTPTHGVGLPKEQIPVNVQSATSTDLERAQSMDLARYLNTNLGSVNINEVTGNPLQPDVQFRGFTSSPLLGTPQGLAVYVDGVRVNEVFGDIVNWDLIPDSIISSINLIGGANPLFGQNTLGGALSIQTKNGFTDPGISNEVSGGSFGRVTNSFEAGGNNGTLGYFLNVRYFDEDGWRKASPSNAVNVYGSVGWHTSGNTLDLHVYSGDTSLTGLQPIPVQQLAQDRRAFFTATDNTGNTLAMVNLEGAHWFNEKTEVSGNVYYRSVDTNGFNSNVAPFTSDGAGFLVDDDGNPVLDQNGAPVPDTFNASNVITKTQQQSYGGALQFTFLQSLFQRGNQFIAGAAWNQGLVDFNSKSQAAQLLPTLFTTTDANIFFPIQASGLSGRSRTVSGYFTDTLSLTDKLNLTVSGRYNNTHIVLADALGTDPQINGQHDFTRFNPAAGLTWQALPALNVYGGYSESSRAPTQVELECADSTAPCLLPNSFLSDPPLKQVVAKSFEGGLRGKLMNAVDWNVDAFSTTNGNDIIFQTTGGANASQGFFSNVGDTQRQGMELNLSGKYRQLRWFANYSFVEATFETPFIASSPFNPKAQDLNGDGVAAEIQVKRGDRIPGIPEHSLKLGGDYSFTPQLTLGADLIYNSNQFLRGDEANLLSPIDGYAIVNLRGQYEFNKHLTVFADIENLFDTDYENFGILGDPTPVFPSFTNPRFLSPGAPRGGWVGIKISL
ncbi:MAG TPA: TonB-dependent receptor [Gammaproteobacteria bacterium]|nr:TonB-dependent receptor [Gammaproteobacteria bacterium]